MNRCRDFRLPYPALCRGRFEPARRLSVCNSGAGMRPRTTALTGILAVILVLAVTSGIALAQQQEIADPTTGFGRVFGLGGHACKQYDDTGKLYIYTEGLPSTEVMSWLQRSDGGTRPNIPMPEELETALPLLPGCLPGKHHAATRTG